MWNKIHSFLRVHLMSSDRCIQLYNHHHTQSGNRTFPSFPKSFLMTLGSPLPLYFTLQMDTMTTCPKQEVVTMVDRYKGTHRNNMVFELKTVPRNLGRQFPYGWRLTDFKFWKSRDKGNSRRQ